MVNLDACWENRRMVEDGISTRYFTLNSTLVIEFYLHIFACVVLLDTRLYTFVRTDVRVSTKLLSNHSKRLGS